METARQRKSHKKSRHGCSQCKERRIKCDEQKPKCGQCLVKSFSCSLEFITPGARSVLDAEDAMNGISESRSGTSLVIRDAPSLVTQLSPIPGYSQRELKLFHHFISASSLTLTGDRPEKRIVAKATIVQLACSNESLMRNILSLAALHLARDSPQNDSDLLNTAIELQNTAIIPFRRELGTFDKHSCHAIFASCLIINCFNCALFSVDLLYSPQGKYEGLNGKPLASIHQSLIRWMRMLQGTTPVITAGWEWLRVGPLSPFLQYPELEGLGKWEKQPDTAPVQPDCLVHLDRYWRTQLRLGNIPAAEALVCLEALGKLRAIYAVLALSQHDLSRAIASSDADGGALQEIQRTDIALAWYVLVPETFVRLVEEGNPNALCLLAYSGALLKDSKMWWSENVGKTVVLAVARLVQDQHGVIYDDLLQWPLEQIHSSPERALY